VLDARVDLFLDEVFFFRSSFLVPFFYGGARSLLQYIFFFGFPFRGSFGLLLLPLSTSIFLRNMKVWGGVSVVDLSTFLVDSLFSGSSHHLLDSVDMFGSGHLAKMTYEMTS
jgi:hypothetical protein